MLIKQFVINHNSVKAIKGVLERARPLVRQREVSPGNVAFTLSRSLTLAVDRKDGRMDHPSNRCAPSPGWKLSTGKGNVECGRGSTNYVVELKGL